jgi:hypothetical protein
MNKHHGDIGEITFMLRAKQNGFTVLTPYSSHSPYDIAIDNGQNIIKVQVKSTTTNITKDGKNYENAFKVVIGRGRSKKDRYERKDVDVFAVYIARIDKFYIIPFDDVKTKLLNFYPTNPQHHLNKYLERWDYLK